jgi:hypothetical protein
MLRVAAAAGLSIHKTLAARAAIPLPAGYPPRYPASLRYFTASGGTGWPPGGLRARRKPRKE